ncbi:Austinol synthesis protein J [Lachnellula arida]|uniref:Austinol synthesis protein J n=1 Tax=Lachnellula arida TaxID=1316785 RepID=A0A8T9BN67_9HELO|nr:Austinol synthesis protein J [Lachnellula arida]
MTSTRHQTALHFIQAFETLSVDTFLSLQTPTCQHIFAPASLSVPPKNNAAFAAHIAGIKQLMEGFPVTAKEVIDSQGSNQVVVWATSETRFRDEVKDTGIPEDEWAYKGEYLFVFTMDESGEKIERVLEFLDSKKTKDTLGPLMARARGNKARIEGDKFVSN